MKGTDRLKNSVWVASIFVNERSVARPHAKILRNRQLQQLPMGKNLLPVNPLRKDRQLNRETRMLRRLHPSPMTTMWSSSAHKHQDQ
jgi:hypothetical protein